MRSSSLPQRRRHLRTAKRQYLCNESKALRIDANGVHEAPYEQVLQTHERWTHELPLPGDREELIRTMRGHEWWWKTINPYDRPPKAGMQAEAKIRRLLGKFDRAEAEQLWREHAPEGFAFPCHDS